MPICQISYQPIASDNAFDEVEDVIDFIKKYDLETEVNDMSTIVRGEFDEILKLIDALYREKESEQKQFRLDVDLLNSKAYS